MRGAASTGSGTFSGSGVSHGSQATLTDTRRGSDAEEDTDAKFMWMLRFMAGVSG